ncbi:hypothetical protein CDAR_598921 [Caerostris darwini]|uniref:Reverse transcriptase domain-containing protein n=1 Tax=Caerostris darwini TaxID=1538125 RepID=A0AAV4R514_9ARAC|nr:hypothetical protein CDAR_598921 [Caerostris darwini]
MVYNRLNWYLESHSLLAGEQAGFRKFKSTAHPVTLFSQAIKDALDSKQVLTAVAIDLKSAYDTVWKENLPFKLNNIDLVPAVRRLDTSCDVLRSISYATINELYPESERLRIYTDGSRMEQRINSGAGVFCDPFSVYAPVGSFASAYDGAEYVKVLSMQMSVSELYPLMRCDPSSERPVARASTHRQIPEVVFSVSCQRFRTRDVPPRDGSGQASRKVRGARGRETHPVKVVHPARRRTSFSSLNSHSLFFCFHCRAAFFKFIFWRSYLVTKLRHYLGRWFSVC